MNGAWRRDGEGTRGEVKHDQINLGRDIDVARRGEQRLLVANLQDAGSLNVAEVIGTYTDIVGSALDGELVTPWPGIRRATLIDVPIMPGLVRVAVVP